MKCYTLVQGHPYPDNEPIPGEPDRPINPVAKIFAVVVIALMVVMYFYSKKRES